MSVVIVKIIFAIHARVMLLISYMYTLGDGANFSSKWRLHTKVKIINCIFGDQERKQNFSTFRLRILEI